MSDARAKAEARRAKILARENNRLSLAKGETPKVSRIVSLWQCHGFILFIL